MDGIHPARPGLPATAPDGSVGRGPRTRRSARDWAVDISAFLLAAAFSVLTSEAYVNDPRLSEDALALDQILGALACCALWLRKRWPVGVALACAPVSVFSHFVSGPQMFALFSLAVHRRLRTVALVLAATFAAGPFQQWVRPDPELSPALSFLVGGLLLVAPVGWGMFVRSRRQLVASLEERAVRAETEAALRAEQAQRAAREAIAREMHDVLAHRLSLLSVHAGA
ncbi:histidine kinase dimerization/phosphoacceptor domain-containing protein, partial [Streptomyces daliensis]|nr:histidine kinase dimerization/phosphoacceptor domain-containing protein [Streptomyces daliensis]